MIEYVYVHYKATQVGVTFIPSFAEVSKYGIFPFSKHHCFTLLAEVCRFVSSESALFPKTTNGKVEGE